MAKRTKEDSYETREKLIEAASLIFEKKGFQRATLEEIAEEAGVTRGALYWHFKNKVELFQALYEKLYVPFSQKVLTDLEINHPEPLMQLKDLCLSILLEIENDQQKKRILTILYLRCDYCCETGHILELQNKVRQKNSKMFDKYFERAKEKGFLSPATDSQVLTLSLFCFLNGIVFDYLRGNGSFSIKKTAPSLLNLFFKGIAGK